MNSLYFLPVAPEVDDPEETGNEVMVEKSLSAIKS